MLQFYRCRILGMSNIKDAVEQCGGPARVASALGVSTQAVCFWRDGKRGLPAEHCAEIERLCGGAVRRWHLRPADWHVIWPELVGTEGAPDLPEVEQREAA